MKSKLVEKLNFKMPPVAIFFTAEKPDHAMQFQEGKHGCVAAMLIAASKGKVVVFDDKTYGCPGGGVGLCFGDTFTKNHHPTEYLLSTGNKELAEKKGGPKALATGERFYASPELAKKWKDSFPYTELQTKYVIFKPLALVAEDEKPDLIQLYANPDQLSSLIIMSGFYRGTSLNVLAPYCATCQSIVFAYQQINQQEPKAIMGWFDISNRNMLPKELLSFTVPFKMFQDIEKGVDSGCLTTDAWAKIAHRYDETKVSED
jgi:uncharacterized protein (DUF169 family)